MNLINDLLKIEWIAVAIILVLGFVAYRWIIQYQRGQKSNPYLLEWIPVAFPMIGMLATFIGVTIGLYNFESASEKLASSITDLLHSLRFVFVASGSALLLSILLQRWVALVKKRSEQKNVVTVAGIDTLNQAMAQMQSYNQSQQNVMHQIQTQLAALLEEIKNNNNDNKEIINKLIQVNQQNIRLTETLEKSNREVIDLNKNYHQKTTELINKLNQNLSDSANQISKTLNNNHQETINQNKNQHEAIFRKIKEETERLHQDFVDMVIDLFSKSEEKFVFL
jgi:CRISPR/Cas system-associated exonuclease Cas4 (RecB family)